MSVLSKEQLLKNVTALYEDANSDEALAMLADLSDTYDSLGSTADADEWKKKYEDNDKAWRERYRERFFNPEVKDKDLDDKKEEEEPAVKTSYDELFITKED